MKQYRNKCVDPIALIVGVKCLIDMANANIETDTGLAEMIWGNCGGLGQVLSTLNRIHQCIEKNTILKSFPVFKNENDPIVLIINVKDDIYRVINKVSSAWGNEEGAETIWYLEWAIADLNRIHQWMLETEDVRLYC